MAQQGLTRYDASTFRPIRRIENPNHPVIPRFSLPGESYPHQELAIIPRAPLFYGDTRVGSPPQKPPEPVQMNPEPSEDWEEALFNNQSIGVHRFSYLFNKIPGIIWIMIGAWTLFGRGTGEGGDFCTGKDGIDGCLVSAEKAMGISSFVSGILLTISVTAISQNHNFNLNNAHFQSILRMITSALHTFLSLVVAVFSAIALAQLNDKTESTYPTCYPVQCFNLNERIGQSGTLLGVSLLILVLSIVSIFFGIVGVAQINKDKRERKEARQRRQYVEYATLPPSNYVF